MDDKAKIKELTEKNANNEAKAIYNQPKSKLKIHDNQVVKFIMKKHKE